MDTVMAVPAASAPDTAADLDIGIEGMTCASRVRRVERALGQVPGVSAVSVNLVTERGRVADDGTPGTAAALVEAVGRAGYAAATQVMDLSVSGMTCASCVGRVERALKRVPGGVGHRARDLGFSLDAIRRLLALRQDCSRTSQEVKRIALDTVAELRRKMRTSTPWRGRSSIWRRIAAATSGWMPDDRRSRRSPAASAEQSRRTRPGATPITCRYGAKPCDLAYGCSRPCCRS